MNVRKILPIPVVFLLIVQAGALAPCLWAQTAAVLKCDASRIPWTFLRYEDDSSLINVTTEVHLRALPAAEVKAALIENHQGEALPVPDAGSYEIVVNTVLNPHSQNKKPATRFNQVWFDPRDATPLGRLRTSKNENDFKDDFKKSYRFTRQGVFRHNREPRDKQEAGLAPEQWSKVVDTFYPYDLAQLDCPNVSDRLLLIYIASAAEALAAGQPLTLCVFGKRQLFRVVLRPAGMHAIKNRYTIKKQLAVNQQQGEVEALKIDLEAQPLPSNLEKAENFSFLGFHKNIAFFMDPASNLVLQVTGKIEGLPSFVSAFVDTTLYLRDVRLKSASP